jgi:uncharacterized protein YjbJ (UPF0337 family)
LGSTFVVGTSDKMSDQFNDRAGKANEAIGKAARDKHTENEATSIRPSPA